MGGISRQQKAFYGPYHDHEYDDDDDEDAAAAAAAPAGRKDSFGYGSCGSDKDDPDGGPDLAAAEAPASGTGSGRASASDPGDVQLYTLEEERAIVKKFDRKLVLFMALLYMLNFLDRSSMFCCFFLSLFIPTTYEGFHTLEVQYNAMILTAVSCLGPRHRKRPHRGDGRRPPVHS